MYKIYYNDTLICLCHRVMESIIDTSADDVIKIHYPGRTKFLLNYIDKVEKNRELREMYIFTADLPQLKADFLSLFKIVKAAGGLVLNAQREMLMIYRRGAWDLPKGKMESGETRKMSAVREVQEETGLKHIELIQKLHRTYHIYRSGSGTRVLKPSYWYLMYSDDTTLIPQTEEDIEKAEWVSLGRYHAEIEEHCFANIRDVVNKWIGRS